jgi:hypothetical protein
MLVEILKDVFESDDDEVVAQLNKVWNIIERRHSLLIRDFDLIDMLPTTIWFNKLMDSEKESIFQYIKQSSSHTKKDIVKCTISLIETQNNFTLIEAIKYLEQPLTILLENRMNDAPFVQSLIKNFRKHGRKIESHLSERWLRFGMGGGSTMIDDINAELDSFYSDYFTKEKWKYLRYFVLSDSDKTFPEMPLPPNKASFKETLESYKIPYHFLEKREMENYLPDEAFSEITNNRLFIDAYLKLKPLQKDYFDLQKGFENKNFDTLPLEIQKLYDEITNDSKEIFRKQDLSKINSETDYNFKREFPKLFKTNKVNRENLLGRCSHHYDDSLKSPNNKMELPSILEKIYDSL